MKSKFTIMLVVIGLICWNGAFVSNAQADSEEKGSVMEGKGSPKGSMAEGQIAEEVTGTGAIKVGNKICPLSKEKVGEMGPAVEYEHEGKIYNFCCKMCLKDFKKDPEKYIKIINESMEGGEDSETD